MCDVTVDSVAYSRLLEARQLGGAYRCALSLVRLHLPELDVKLSG